MDDPTQGGLMPNRPTFENKTNWNTWISLGGLIVTLSLGLIGYGKFTQSVSDLDRRFNAWTDDHEQFHAQRQVDTTADRARMDERIKSIEAEARSLENIRYRLTVQEQGATNLARTVDELRQAIAQQNSDIRLIREIVTRLDPGPQRKP